MMIYPTSWVANPVDGDANHAEAVLVRILGLINYKKIFMVYELQLEQASGSSGIRTHDGTEKMIFCTTTAIAGCW